jgi:hypothetical protein
MTYTAKVLFGQPCGVGGAEVGQEDSEEFLAVSCQ